MSTTRPSTHVRHDRAHVFHSWSAQALINPLPSPAARGVDVGRRRQPLPRLLSSQLMNVNIGHQHPKLVAAIQEQADKLCTIAPFHANAARSEAARLIVEAGPTGDLDMVFFTNGGAEANENAIRMARLHTGRHKVLRRYRSYHGATAGSITLTGDPRRWPASRIPGVVKFWGPYPYRSRSTPTTEAEECERALAAPRRHAHGRGPAHRGRDHPRDRSSAPTASSCRRRLPRRRARAVRPPRHPADRRRGHGRLRSLRRVVRHPALGRQPDLICFAKGVNSGLRAARRRGHLRAIADTFDERPTPAASPTAATRWPAPRPSQSINIFKEEGIVERARTLGTDVIGPSLEKLAARHPSSATCAASACSGRSSWSGPRDPRDAGAVQRRRRRREAHGSRSPPPARSRACGGAVHPLQPGARRAAVQHRNTLTGDRPTLRARGTPRGSPSPLRRGYHCAVRLHSLGVPMNTELAERTDDTVADDAIVATDEIELIEDELLVEEISIDGMCGVY
jgi:taurine--2-oxoglutarate transaminase